LPTLHAQLVNRIMSGGIVGDHEEITGLSEATVAAVAVYRVAICYSSLSKQRHQFEDHNMMSTTEVQPFRIAVPETVLLDLRTRLRNTRLPDAELVNDWSQGAPLAWIQDMCSNWQDSYNWRDRESQLNQFSQFTTSIDGLNIHFIHVRSQHPHALPLVMTHGWPGSIVEFQKVIAPLTPLPVPTVVQANSDSAAAAVRNSRQSADRVRLRLRNLKPRWLAPSGLH
jgi:hypothetical protein